GLVGDISIKMTIGSSTATFNNLPIQLDVPAQMIGGRTFVPVRFIADNLGKTVDWDGDNYIVKINSK
ncbi:MAG: copper amine oxidase N-terminal domain-containing protein, partial [Vallitaleaceae bacterium]|nr:copper amine oxidase N-terminal domain-containing protein [Vallitaleaceae bacterium]